MARGRLSLWCLSGREDGRRDHRRASEPARANGHHAIDAMIPIGRGQRELIIGDRSTGETTICSTRLSARRVSTKRRRRPPTKSIAPFTAFT